MKAESKTIEIRIESVYNGYLITCNKWRLPEGEPSTQADSPFTPYGAFNNRYVAHQFRDAVDIVGWLLGDKAAHVPKLSHDDFPPKD